MAAGLVVVAEDDRGLIGVAQRGRVGADHVVWKLYVHPSHRGRGLGPQLLHALIFPLRGHAGLVWIEHFAANVRSGAFDEREGFVVQRIDASGTGDHGLDQVWRARPLVRHRERCRRRA